MVGTAHRISSDAVRAALEKSPSLRSLLLDPVQAMHPETETLLIFAARREHIARVIVPALAQGKVVRQVVTV